MSSPRNILTQQFGGSFVASKVRIPFRIAGEEVCQVDVGPAKEPMILTVKDKNGVASRNSMSKRQLVPRTPLSELSTYWAMRFAA